MGGEGREGGKGGKEVREGKRERGGATAPQNGSLYSPLVWSHLEYMYYYRDTVL